MTYKVKGLDGQIIASGKLIAQECPRAKEHTIDFGSIIERYKVLLEQQSKRIEELSEALNQTTKELVCLKEKVNPYKPYTVVNVMVNGCQTEYFKIGFHENGGREPGELFDFTINFIYWCAWLVVPNINKSLSRLLKTFLPSVKKNAWDLPFQ